MLEIALGEIGFRKMKESPNEITSLDAAMTLLFHVVTHSRGASEFGRYLHEADAP
jgi:hypothetical protein